MSACGQPDEAGYSESFFADDTFITFTAYGDNAEKAVSAAREKFTESERLWSVTNENSEIYALNHSGGQAVNVSAETAEILEFALDMSERTGGALDPTVYPILRSWGFTTDENRIPSDDEIKDLLPLVGYGNVGLNGVSVRLPENMMDDGEIVMPNSFSDFLKHEMKVRKIKGRECALVLPARQVICRFVTMPQMTQDQLELNLPYEFNEFVQNDPETFFFDYAMCEPEEGDSPDQMYMMAAASAYASRWRNRP